MQKPLALLIILAALSSCQPASDWEKDWRFELLANDQVIPFNVELYEENGQWKADFRNGSEILTMDEVFIQGDSFHISMGIFDAALFGRKVDQRLEGTYHRAFEGDYYLPFTAQASNQRFPVFSKEQPKDFSGRWAVTFTEADGSTYDAVGIFDQNDQTLTGTFLTETGDYRYLEGNADANIMRLSVFDGSHVFLFQAMMQGDSMLSGGFWSGKHYYARWTASRDDQASLKSPDSLTFLKAGFDKLAFSFPDTSGALVSLNDFAGQPTVVQLLGTWCPNCMDETIFLSNWIKDNPDSQVNILGLAYEYKDQAYATERVKKLTKKLNVPYPILVAGSEDKQSASKTLPMLNKIISFPTTIFLNADHEVVRIHTGFSGPGTGEPYEKFKKDFDRSVLQISE